MSIHININTQQNIKLTLFPDNQPHVTIPPFPFGTPVSVTCSITDSIKLVQLMETANAIDNSFGVKSILEIPYLMGARFDRQMQDGDSVDLKVIANVINHLGFKKVVLYDVHSETAVQLINNCVNQNNYPLVMEYTKEDAILICPDAGAVKKVDKYLTWNKNLVDVVYVNKTRDLKDKGRLHIKVLEPEKCEGRNCVIIDDLCDGGGTFLGIADQIKPKHLTLIVTHGVFSQGFSKLEEKFQEIIVSNSYRDSYNSNIVKTINS